MKVENETKALLESGADAVVLDIDQRISDAGFTWALDKPTNAAYEVIPTRAVKSAYKLLGGPAFTRMLELMAGAWHGSQASPYSWDDGGRGAGRHELPPNRCTA